MAMKKFRLLIGTHNEGQVDNEGKPVVDKDGKQIFQSYQVTRDAAGQYNFPIIRTERDLDKTFNAGPDSQKFQRVYREDDEPLPASMVGMPQDTLESMTVAELRQMASEEEIDLRGATKREEILKAIREALQPA